MIWHFVLNPSTAAPERHSCRELQAHPELYGGNGLIQRFAQQTSDHELALSAISIETMILLIGYQEYRGVLWFSEDDHFRRIEDTLDELLSESCRRHDASPHVAGPPALLARDQYEWLIDQNREVSDWIRRRLAFVIQTCLRPSMHWALADLGEEARRAGLPSRLFVVPFFERMHTPARPSEQLPLL